MGYQEAFADIRADFQRYAKLIRGGQEESSFPAVVVPVQTFGI